MTLYNEVYNYIIRFLINNEKFCDYDYIHYLDYNDFSNIKKGVIIKHSAFFNKRIYGTINTIPTLPLKEIEGIPIFFGDAYIEIINKELIVCHADIIASTYYLISRYEEMVLRSVRDEHGRFQGKKSILYMSGNLEIPIVDYWGRLLRKCLGLIGKRVEEPDQRYHSISLTHDVDMPWHKYDFRQTLRAIGSNLKHKQRLALWPLLNLFGYYGRDPLYTFHDIILCDDRIKSKMRNCEEVYFIVAGREIEMRSTNNYIHDAYFKKLLKLLDDSEVKLGWHISYEAGNDIELMKQELCELDSCLNRKLTRSRNHFLRSCEPEDFQYLCDIGIKDDYTMGFADCVGFRLGTAHNVKWINPTNGFLTSLTLHPLQIMDVTLTDYMNLNYLDAIEVCGKVMEETQKNNGDLTLLWHNSTLSDECNRYIKTLYRELLNDLC